MILILGDGTRGEHVIAKALAEHGIFGGEGILRATKDCPRGAYINQALHHLCTVPYLQHYLPVKTERTERKGKPLLIKRYDLEKAATPYCEEAYFSKPPYFRERVLEILRREGRAEDERYFVWSPWNLRMASVWTRAFPEAQVILCKDSSGFDTSTYEGRCLNAAKLHAEPICMNVRKSNRQKSAAGMELLLNMNGIHADKEKLAEIISQERYTFNVERK